MESKQTIGHMSAFLTIMIWGTTFIPAKILLKDFRPVEILPVFYGILWMLPALLLKEPLTWKSIGGRFLL